MKKSPPPGKTLVRSATIRVADNGPAGTLGAKPKVEADKDAKGNKADNKKCDAKLPENGPARRVALVTFGEASGQGPTQEFEAIVSVIHNRVGNPDIKGKPATTDDVIMAKGEFLAYKGARYLKGERLDLEPGDCDALKKAIATTESIGANGVPDTYKGLIFFAAKDAVSIDRQKTGKIFGGTVFGSKKAF